VRLAPNKTKFRFVKRILVVPITPLLIFRRLLQQTQEGLAMDFHATNFAPRIPRHHDASMCPAVSCLHGGFAHEWPGEPFDHDRGRQLGSRTRCGGLDAAVEMTPRFRRDELVHDLVSSLNRDRSVRPPPRPGLSIRAEPRFCAIASQAQQGAASRVVLSRYRTSTARGSWLWQRRLCCVVPGSPRRSDSHPLQRNWI
jgi:hypothetical protein